MIYAPVMQRKCPAATAQNRCKPAAADHSPDIGGFDGSLRFVPVTVFIAFIWQGGTGCDGGIPYLSGHFSPVLSGACGL